PSTAGFTGLPSSMRVGPIGPSPSSVIRLPCPPATALRSAPAQKVPPAPVRMATAAVSSASKVRKASANAAAVGPSTALRTSGRSIVTTVTGPGRPVRTGACVGLGGMCDREQRLCLAFAFWNGRDPILKERIFGLGGPEGNHGEDAKEYWFYVDSTPTHSWMQWRYFYPQREFPYSRLVGENGR